MSGASPNDWSWHLGIHLWLPTVEATTRFQLPDGGTIGSRMDTDYLDNLKFAFMGTVEARRGPWSIMGDVVQLRFADEGSKVSSITGPGGAVTIPINSSSETELKGFVTTILGGYALAQSPASRMDLVAGARYARIEPELKWQLSTTSAGGLATSGTVGATKDFWDGVVGMRGIAALGGNWDLRYYGDIGAGSSKLTWQAQGGIGYRFGWGDVVVSYRHLVYEFDSDRPMSDVSFSGPQFSLGWRF